MPKPTLAQKPELAKPSDGLTILRKCASQPARTAPAIPKIIVTAQPPGSLPGIIILAITPAIKPTIIQDKTSQNPIKSSLFVSARRKTKGRAIGCYRCSLMLFSFIEETTSERFKARAIVFGDALIKLN